MQDPRGEEQRGEAQTLGWFALVSYLPDPLARFLDDLRVNLSPGCNPRAHVTVLPPRPLHHDLRDTIAQIRNGIGGFAPFRIEVGAVEIFDVSNVVFLGLAAGAEELRRLYLTLNCGPLAFREDFPYHPHITIAPNPDRREADRRAGMAQRQWAKYKGSRDFAVSSVSFVQHVAPSIWADVATLPLGDDPTPSDASEADASESSPSHSGVIFQPR